MKANPPYVVFVHDGDDYWQEFAVSATKDEAMAIVKAMPDGQVAEVHDSVGRVGASTAWFDWFLARAQEEMDWAIAERAAKAAG